MLVIQLVEQEAASWPMVIVNELGHSCLILNGANEDSTHDALYSFRLEDKVLIYLSRNIRNPITCCIVVLE